MTKRRRWHTGMFLLVTTASRTMSMLSKQRMGRFAPFLGFLLLGSALLWVVNTIAPLAPFVYSLF